MRDLTVKTATSLKLAILGILYGSVTVVVADTIPSNPTPVATRSADGGRKAAEEVGALDEIVVTAEKRASTVQDTAISMTAVSAAQLEQAGISGLAAMTQSVPGISMRSAGPGQNEVEMRGLSSSGGSSPTVGFYLDDYPLTPPAAAVVGKVVIDPDLFDLNRVEVLRGPQGTLYGSGSMGGTIKLVPSEPKLNVFEGAVQASLSTTDGGRLNRGGSAMLNLPLVDDRLALRLVATDKYTDGWLSRIVVDQFPFPVNAGPCGGGWPGCERGDVAGATPSQVVPRVNWERLQGGRAEILAKPTDDLSIKLLAMYQGITMGGYNEFDAPPGTTLAHYQPYNIGEPFADHFGLFGATITYNLGFADLTSATAYYTRVERQTQDSSEAIYSVINLYGFPDSSYLPVTFSEFDTTRQFSQELRLSSNGTGALEWIAGAFYSRFESIFEEVNDAAPLAGLSSGGATANPLGIIYQAHNPYHIKQAAIFGEASYKFDNGLKLTGGLRWYSFKTEVDEESSGIATASGNATPTLSSFSASSTGFNPKVTLSYQPTKNQNLYGTAARGFRPGGVNQQIPSGIGCNLTGETYGPDSIWNYEVGEKAKLLDGQLTVNADVYYIRWASVQQLINQGCGYPLTQNAGIAKSYGPEIEITAHLSPEWTVAASGTYTHAALSSVNPELTAANSAFVAGAPILNIPNYTASASVTYSVPINERYKVMVRATDSYVGSVTDISYVYETLSPYNLVGLRAGLIGDKLSTFVYVDNLTNKHAELGINTTSFDWVIPSLVRVATNAPRTIGVEVKYQF